ncbi:mdm2-binding protein isoform X2 [Ascaphus truei]|uniref:mdm2-binding protein isoform X2 n=1 Tax=Ascaphus truei TaxID=8439 RepID=UPI003F5AC8C7
MERFVLFLSWERRPESGREEQPVPAGLANAKDVYTQLKKHCIISTSAFPACSVSGSPGARKWYFAIQAIYGSFQFSSANWEDLSPAIPPDDGEDLAQTAIEECLTALQNNEDEDGNSRDSISQTDLFEESAESLHQLSDKLPAPGRAMVEVLLLSSDSDVPRLKDCLPAIGAIKHMKEWHSAKITIATKDCRGWQKIAEYLSASIVTSECLQVVIDPQELWRGTVQISERKFGSEVRFPEFCLQCISEGTSKASQLAPCTEPVNNADEKRRMLPEVFHYYSSSLEFVRMVALLELPSYFMSHFVFELSLTRNSVQGKSKLMLDQLCSLNEKVGALFMLPCNVSSLLIPPAFQLSTRKWKEYMSRKPKVINVPDIALKGESCSYYFLIQGKDNGICKATLLHSANQMNGAASLALLHGRLNELSEDKTRISEDTLSSLPHFHGDQILRREKTLARSQTLAVNEYLKSEVIELNPVEWPERNVLQNLENLEKIKQRIRASILSGSTEQLFGRKDGQREAMTQLDAKELLKYFTPQGLALGELQPLQVQRGENAFLLTPKLTPRKLKGLPFEKASACHYHGLEYCLDNRKALERDVAFVELQSRLIRYETQTTCTRECCPFPFALSPLPSPAVLSEPGSVPDGELLQSELRVDPLRLKRRSKELDGLYANKRLAKSESSDSLLSLANESIGYPLPFGVKRLRPERAVSVSSSVPLPSSQTQTITNKPAQSRHSSLPEQENKKSKESRSQKHIRMLKEVVSKTLQIHGIEEGHPCFAACSQRLFEISKFYLKDLKTSRGLMDEMKKTASNNAKQVIEWELEKLKKK